MTPVNVVSFQRFGQLRAEKFPLNREIEIVNGAAAREHVRTAINRIVELEELKRRDFHLPRFDFRAIFFFSHGGFGFFFFPLPGFFLNGLNGMECFPFSKLPRFRRAIVPAAA